MATEDGMTDEGKLLFGAGFVFGVAATLVLLIAVLVVATPDQAVVDLLRSSILVTVVAGVLFAAIVGGALYVLAFPETRMRIPIDPEQFERED